MKTSTKKDKDVSIKFNIAPSKHYGFINFINLALEQGKPVILSFEKVSKTGEKEESKIVGTFKFEGKDETLKQLEEKIKEKEKKRKKQHQKRVQG